MVTLNTEARIETALLDTHTHTRADTHTHKHIMRSQSVPPLLSQVKRALLFPFTFALCWSRKEGRSIESTI